MGEGFPPSGPWLPWHGRGESPSKIGYVSLSLSVSVLHNFALSPFLKFPEIRNSDWIEIWTRFLSGYWLSCGKRRAPIALRGVHEGPGRAPLPRGPLGHRLTLILLPKIHKYSKKISVHFYPVWTPFDIGFLRNKKHATDRNWHWALYQYVSPKK